MGTKAMVKHFLHKHELEFCEEIDCGGNCTVCKQHLSGPPHYHCIDNCPEISIHKNSCSEIPLHMQHPFHPEHTLFFSDNVHPTEFCDACGGNCYKGFVYKCLGCAFLLDVKCSLLTLAQDNQVPVVPDHLKNKILPPPLPNHPHPLILCDRDKNFSYSCCCCHLVIENVGPVSGSGSVYVCPECKGLLHNSCAELPWETEHPFHHDCQNLNPDLMILDVAGFYTILRSISDPIRSNF